MPKADRGAEESNRAVRSTTAERQAAHWRRPSRSRSATSAETNSRDRRRSRSALSVTAVGALWGGVAVVVATIA